MKARTTAAEPTHASRSRGPFFSRHGARAAAAPPFFQPKLTIGPPGDRFEQEADRVADLVVAGETAPAVRRMCAGCAEEKGELRRQPLEEEEEMVQTAPDPDLRRQPAEEEEEEPIQTKPELLQRQPLDEEEEELVQATAETPLRRQPAEEEELAQPKREPLLRRQPLEQEEELAQAKRGPGHGASPASPAVHPRLAPGVIRRTPQTTSPAGEEAGELTLVPASELGINVEEAKRRSMLPVQRMVRVGAVDDPAEHEADRMAETVLGMGQPLAPSRGGLAPLSPPSRPSVQRASWPASATGRSAAVGSLPTARLAGASGGDRPLATATRAFYEPRFGLDLGSVRLHEGPRAASAARQLNARAFTYGTDVWLGAGESESDRRLMAHELAHVVQAAGAAARVATLRRAPLISTMDIDELGFTGDHMITAVTGTLGSTSSNIDDPDGSSPIWTSAGTRHPVAYTKGTAPTIFASFIVPSGSPTVRDVGLRVLVGKTAVGDLTGQTITADKMSVTGLQLDDSVVGSSLAKRSPTLRFEFTTDLGASWQSAGSATVQIFATEGRPTPPGGKLRADVLDFGITAAVAGSTAVAGLRKFVQSSVTYDPSAGMPPNFTNSDAVLGALSTPHQCDSQAYLLRYLAKSLGIAADVEYFWQGKNSSEHVVFFAPTLRLQASFQCDRPAEDGAPKKPHFIFHAVTHIGGNLHDATYDEPGLPPVLERAPGTSNQRGDRSTYFGTTMLVSSWRCAH